YRNLTDFETVKECSSRRQFLVFVPILPGRFWVSMRKLINGSMQNVSRSGEKGGPACGWWKVESSMLE
uniref:hypothetical protein n=1 Tax=uncultured Allisonella sp. TaxID=339338 RepID=UPI002585C21C